MTEAMTLIRPFIVGHTYSCRSICDYECIFRFTIKARTAKTVTIEYHGKATVRKIRISNGAETIDPMGRYSMSPVITADDDKRIG